MPWKKREPALDLELTDRQQEVLALIAKGRTNPEIAGELGITLDGAKWHVREILSKLGVESREDAASYWRAHQRPGRRLARTLGTFGSLGLAKGLAVGLAVAAVALLGVTALQSLQSGDPAPASSATATPSPEPTPTSTGPTATTVPPPSISAEEVGLLPGMFLEPRPTPVADIELPVPPEPTPTFEWDGESTMIYDRETGELINLGPGEPARFSPDGEWAVWVSVNRFEGDLHAINLNTGERKDLGDGGYVSHFVDDDRFYLDIESTRYAVSVLSWCHPGACRSRHSTPLPATAWIRTPLTFRINAIHSHRWRGRSGCPIRCVRRTFRHVDGTCRSYRPVQRLNEPLPR